MTNKETIEKEKDFEEMVSEYGSMITKICYYFSNDTEEFKDLRQEILYNLWKGRDSFRNDSKLSTWIYRVCLNTCISFQRKEKKFKDYVPLENIFDIEDDSDTSRLKKYNKMHSLIQKLKYEDRAILLLWLDDKNYEEIASLIGINRNTLATKLKRIKEKLARMANEG